MYNLGICFIYFGVILTSTSCNFLSVFNLNYAIVIFGSIMSLASTTPKEGQMLNLWNLAFKANRMELIFTTFQMYFSHKHIIENKMLINDFPRLVLF
jgi:hypothetical protein